MRVRRRREKPVFPVVTTGQSAEWLEVLTCYPLLARLPGDSAETRELRDCLGDMVFLASRLLQGKAAYEMRIADLAHQCAQLEQAREAPRRGRAWRR